VAARKQINKHVPTEITRFKVWFMSAVGHTQARIVEQAVTNPVVHLGLLVQAPATMFRRPLELLPPRARDCIFSPLASATMATRRQACD
jgi:hypothetical protein